MEVIKRLKQYYLLYISLALTTAFYPFVINIAIDFSPKITIHEAKSFLDGKRKKLGIEDKIALQTFDDYGLYKSGLKGFCGRNDYGYIIGASKPDLSRIVIDHELYHFLNGECEGRVGNTITESIRILRDLKLSWKDMFLKEPRANIYALKR